MKSLIKYLLSISIVLIVGCGRVDNSFENIYKPNVYVNLEELDESDDNYYYALDGDTIKVKFDAKITTIRLIGIDTFEIHKNNKAYRQAYENNITIEEVIKRGKKAKEYIIDKLSKHKKFFFEYDEDFLDRYKRTLAYLWFSQDDMFNLDIVCDGYAMPLKIEPNTKYANKIEYCFKNAKKLKIGIWGD